MQYPKRLAVLAALLTCIILLAFGVVSMFKRNSDSWGSGCSLLETCQAVKSGGRVRLFTLSNPNIQTKRAILIHENHVTDLTIREGTAYTEKGRVVEIGTNSTLSGTLFWLEKDVDASKIPVKDILSYPVVELVSAKPQPHVMALVSGYTNGWWLFQYGKLIEHGESHVDDSMFTY